MEKDPEISGISHEIASAFLITPFIKNGILPEEITSKEIIKNFNLGTGDPMSHIRPILTVGWYEENHGAFHLTEKGKNAGNFIGQFLWMASSIDPTLNGKKSHRNMKGVVTSSKLIGSLSTYKAQLDKINRIIKSKRKKMVCEVGCGSAEILAQILKKNPDLCGLGIDIDPDACTSARRTLFDYGLSGRGEILQSDINHLSKEHLQDVDMLIAGFVIHDLGEIREGFRKLVEPLPYGADVILAELASNLIDGHPFAACILTAHQLMGKRIPSIQEWRQIFHNAGLAVVSMETAGIMPGAVLFHLQKTDPNISLTAKAKAKKFNNHDIEVKAIDLTGILPGEISIREAAFADMSLCPEGISDFHTHTDDEVYILPSKCTIEVYRDQEIFLAEGPCAVVISAGQLHKWKPINVKQGDYIIGLFIRKGETKC